MKHIISFILVICCSGVIAQTTFYNLYTDGGFDFGNDIIQLPDDSYLITGSSSSFADAPSQAFLLNIDDQGNYLWSQNYGGVNGEEGRRVLHQPGVGYYVAGYSSSFGTDGNFDAYIFMTDENGQLQWEKNYGGAGWERIWDAILAPDGTILLAGSSDSFGAGQNDMMVMRLDANGDEIWTEYIGTSGNDEARSLKMVNDTTFFVGGTIYNTDSLETKFYLKKMTLNQEVLFENQYGSSGNDQMYDIVEQDGKFQLLGKTTNDATVLTGALGIIILEDGTELVLKLDDKPGDSHFACAAPFAGYPDLFMVISSKDDPSIPTYEDGYDVVFHNFTSFVDYNFQSFGYFNGPGEDIAGNIIETSDGGAIYIGSESYYGIGGSSIVAVKFGPNYEATPNGNVPTQMQVVDLDEDLTLNGISIYPNPVLDHLIIENSSNKILQLSVLSSQGGLIENLYLTDNLTSINTSAWSKGVYFITISDGQRNYIQKVVK